ncbi:carboxypeptidase-like regulatory domain-containing protein [Mariniflexile sp. AS56]|uniref:carboxypeptidase-like regulatory domain-containing protein n=1 Tax=Mariniflexile sp. AS56 TaxID=3063957 RepID=UPI0026ED4DA9|nr:carboxypeptidase-like regulatory domain-containing protein [Mariniflexile sp. AS56]MDO7172406.1 carboxypeptidase-like regulatory domain-containing protein [Mariniflexile sp. AS56]
MYSLKAITLVSAFFLLTISVQSQQNSLKMEGVILDQTKYSIPYAAIGIPSKWIGTSSNEDGKFYLELSKDNLLDTLEVSSIGYLTSKILVKDFLALSEKTIILEEDIVSLDEVNILQPAQYVQLAFKNLKNNTVSSVHELKILNRFFAVENDEAKFFVEHYLKVKDRGPSGGQEVNRIEVVEGRKSADYRFFKDKKSRSIYPINFMTRIDPLRRGLSINDYKWTKTGDTSYDGEDIVIIEAQIKTKKRQPYLDPILYIGVNDFKIYKTTNKSSTVMYIYKKNKDGKLYLSYHNHYTRRHQNLTEHQQIILGTKTKNAKIAVRNEIIVLGIETNKKNIDTEHSDVYRKRMQDVEVKYNSFFWNNFNLPPATAYYKKSVKELESIYGVPLETQFNAVNN